VNLVDEDDGPPPGRAAAHFRGRHDVLDLPDPREHRAELHEVGPGHVGHDARERGLAGARRAPEDDRVEYVPLDRFAQRHPRRENVLLPDDLVERPGANPIGEGSALGGRTFRSARFVVKERICHGACRCRRAA